MDPTQMQIGLPVGVAAFVGRRRELAKVAELVADARVVTLIGSGGCGKTRLAVEVARDVARRFSGGACWVDLQGVTEPRLVAAALGAPLGVRERPGQPLVETLAEQLRGRHVLVVVDNCEHLVGACAQLVSALSSTCPQLHVLATSRVPLAVEGETTFEVAGLPVPDPDASSASLVAAADAARLFELRARQLAANFRIGQDNAPAVAEICRRLDGIPLAIELAAARVRVLSPEQIAAGLADRFALLTGGLRGAPARQRTLEASLDWSYELLDDGLRLALARLSVFAGSFEIDAAEAVVGGEGIDDGDVLDLVAGLVERSLLQVIHRESSARYRLLETVRVYARQRLSELDDPDRVRARHLEFHVGLAQRAHGGLAGQRPEPWVARLTADLDDVRASMDWAAATGDLPGLLAITESIVRFWFERGLSREVQGRLHEAAGTAGAPRGERVRAAITAAAMALASEEPASAYSSATKAVDAARGNHAGSGLAVALGLRAFSGVLSGQSPIAQIDTDVEQAVEHAERDEDASTRAYVLAFGGGALFCSRSIDAGSRMFQQAVELCEANDLAFQLPAAHAALGGGPVPGPAWSGRLEQLRRHARRAVELSGQVGRPGWEAAGLTGLAAAAILQGDHDRAQQWLSRAQAVLHAGGLEETQYGMWVRHWVAVSAYASGDLDAARATAQRIARRGREGGSRWNESVGEWLLGMVARDQGLSGEARAHLEASRELSSEPGLPFPLGRSLLSLGELAHADGDTERAWDLAHDALQVLDDYGDRVGAAVALEFIADLAVALTEPERALRLLGASHRFHADTGIARFPVQTDRFALARDSAHAALHAAAATAGWEAGSQLSLTDAISYALRGRGQRRRPQTGWASLTPVERDVVRLVAEGHTNAEIGRRLFISVNTVKKHLSHVYGKVDVGGRAELAAEVARRDL